MGLQCGNGTVSSVLSDMQWHWCR